MSLLLRAHRIESKHLESGGERLLPSESISLHISDYLFFNEFYLFLVIILCSCHLLKFKVELRVLSLQVVSCGYVVAVFRIQRAPLPHKLPYIQDLLFTFEGFDDALVCRH